MKIEWRDNFFANTEDAAITQHKGIILDFYNVDSPVCRQMEKETYSNRKVIGYINDHLVPFREIAEHKASFEDYGITWTPAVIFTDKFGQEHHRSIGFLGPEEFIATANLALGKISISHSGFDGARHHFDKVIKEVPIPGIVEEAIFYRGICKYKQTGEAEELRKAAEFLAWKHPESIWARKAAPYLTLKVLQPA